MTKMQMQDELVEQHERTRLGKYIIDKLQVDAIEKKINDVLLNLDD